MEEIIIDVSDQGEITLETRNYKGKACMKDSQFIKDLLGRELTSQLTPAYYQTTKKTVKRYLKLCG